MSGLPLRLGPVANEDAGDEQRGHRAEDGPALLGVLGHAAVRVRQRRRNAEDEQHLDHVGDRRRVLERMRAVGVEEAAAVGAELLDDFLRGHGPSAIVCLPPSSVVTSR